LLSSASVDAPLLERRGQRRVEGRGSSEYTVSRGNLSAFAPLPTRSRNSSCQCSAGVFRCSLNGRNCHESTTPSSPSGGRGGLKDACDGNHLSNSSSTVARPPAELVTAHMRGVRPFLSLASISMSGAPSKSALMMHAQVGNKSRNESPCNNHAVRQHARSTT
jgi:hypothetical protein